MEVVNSRAARTGVVIAAAMILGAGCVLDRSGTGGCPRDGKVRCNVSDVEYSFTSTHNSYRFTGRCDVIDEDGASSLQMPSLSFRVSGQYERQSKVFKEAVEVENQTSWSITGLSALDPWLVPTIPVGVSSVAGNPYSFAQRLCVKEVPSKFAHIPFSRNVIIHMLSLAERAAMALAAAQAASSLQAAPPAPPCPPALVTAPSQVVIPTEGLVYAGEPPRAALHLKSKCGADNVNYHSSFYQAFFQHKAGGGWKEYRGFKLAMSADPQGGSYGSEAIPLNATGQWRVRARHVIAPKSGGAQKTGDYSEWVQFWVGKPELIIDRMDVSRVPHLEFAPAAVKEMDAIWKSGNPKRAILPK